MKKITYIICTYNNEEIIGDCLNSIKNQTFSDHECIVYDDNSSDKTVSIIKKKFTWVKVIESKKNQGPSKGRNLCIKKSKGDYIATVDSDMILEKNWAKEQIKFLKKNDRCGIVGSKLMYESNRKKINTVGGRMTVTGIGFDVIKIQENMQFLYVCSAAMMVRKEVIDRIGMFDADYFYGHEDTDLGWRANIAGFDVYTNLEAIGYHRTSETMKKRPGVLYYYATKNRITSMIKNYKPCVLVIALGLYSILSMIDIVFRGYPVEKLKAWVWNISNLGKTLKKRKIVQRTRVKNDCKLMKLISFKLF